MSVLDTHHTPKLSFLLVPKQETDSKLDTQETNILTLHDMIVMRMLPKGRIKMDLPTNLALFINFRGSIKLFDFRKNSAEHGSVDK